jgi:hypothetical protein
MRYAIVFVWFMLFSGLLWAADAPIAGVSPDLSLLIARCAPTVHPETMAAVISAESRGQQYAIADAGPKNMPWAQRKGLVRSYYLASLEDAVATATGLIASGHTVSLGITQVNDRNLASLGISLRDIFDPCTNFMGRLRGSSGQGQRRSGRLCRLTTRGAGFAGSVMGMSTWFCSNGVRRWC